MPARQSPSDRSDWHQLTDAARGTRRLCLDAAGRPVAWIDATGTQLDFAHDAQGNLRRIASGAWFVEIDGPSADRTLRMTDPAGRTDLLLARAGRVRTIARGGDRLSIALDSLERVRRVELPGSVNALAYEWDEEGGCVIRAEGGGPLLTLTEVGPARRIALGPRDYWDEEVQPGRVRLRAVVAGAVQDSLELRLAGLAAIAGRRWSDGQSERFERDDRGRLSSASSVAVDGARQRRSWRYRDADLVEDAAGLRTVGDGGRVLRLDRPDGRQVAYRYDAAGRRIARVDESGETRYFYDPLGSLSAIRTPDGGEVRLATDGMGRRIAVEGGAADVRHEHRDEAGRLWAVTDEQGRAVHTYLWVGDRIAARIDGPIGAPIAEAYLCDPLGTPNGVFVATGEGWRFERLESPPFGRSDDPARPTLYGHFGNPRTGLIHCGARDLDPELGIFLTPDPWHGGEDDPRRWGGAGAELIARQRERPVKGFHDYALCRFDPLGRYDRDGHVSAGDVFLHILRWILLPTWGFPLTSISLYVFQPFNLYMEIIGLILWAFKQGCEDKSHPWGNHTIAKATWLLGSSRQFTFALGLNGFLPRVVAGGGLTADRAVTVGNVIWISDDELDLLGRAEVVEVDDIASGPAGAKFNDDPTKQSVVALLSADAGGHQRLHVSRWTRGLGNGVALRTGVQAFTDTAAAGSARGAIHLRHPAPIGTPLPRDDDADEKLELREFVRGPGDPAADLEAVADVWFSLKVPKDSDLATGDWLRVTAPDASDPKPDAAFRRIRETMPAADHIALILTEPLPARFRARQLKTGLRLEVAEVARSAAPSGHWAITAVATTLNRVVPHGTAPTDFPPDLAVDSMVRIVASTPSAAPPLAGLPAGAPEDTRFTTVKAIRARLTLAPDNARVAAGAALQRMAPSGIRFHGTVEQAAQSDRIKLTAPHPDIAADDLLVVSRAGGAPFYVRARAAPAGDVLEVEPALPAALVPADATAVDLQRTADSGADAGGATVARLAGADIDVTVPRGRHFAAGNLVRIDLGGVPALRRIEAIPQMEIDVADEPVGTGALVLTCTATAAGRVRSGVELAPPGRFLKWTAGTPLSTFGAWPGRLLAIQLPGLHAAVTDTAAHYVRWPAAGRPATFDADFHHVWTIVTQGADQFVVLETPLPIVERNDAAGTMKTFWRAEPDDHAGFGDVLIEPLPVPLRLHALEFATSGTVRTDRPGRRVLAHEPEVLVPDHPSVHDTHRRALIEHEIHHTVQCNYWGPLMGALPLQGLIMSVVDFVAVGGADIPDWLRQVDRDASGNPPATADGRIDNNTELNPFQVFSIGGILQLAWKYAFLLPFRASPDLAAEIDDWDFEDFNLVFNPVSRLVTQNLPQVDPDAPAGDRWLALLGQMLAKALDLRSWTPFLGFVPTLLPDGPTNFIEQGASRASGDLYSTILTVNDRYNLRTRGRLFGSNVDLSANIHSALGRPVRLLAFCGYRIERVLHGAGADVPGATVTYRTGYRTGDPFTITLPDAAQRGLFQDSLYEVRRAAGAPALPPVMIEGPPPSHTPTAFAQAAAGDTVVPRLRALVPMPPRVSRSLGFYLVAAAPGRLTVKTRIPFEVDAEVAIGGTVAAGNTVTLTATSATLPGSPVTIGPVAAPTNTAAALAAALATAVTANAAMQAAGIRADSAGGKTRIQIRRAQEPTIVWTARKTGSLTVSVESGKAAKADPGTESATITIEAEVRLGDEAIEWSEPAPAGALPGGPPALRRFQTEESDLKFRQPRGPAGGGFVDAGIADLVLDLSDAAVASAPLADNRGWKITMPVAVPASPVRIRLYRLVKRDDPAFDLAFPDTSSLAGVRSYLDADTFIVVRDVMLAVEPLPELPAATKRFDESLELTLPIRLVGGSRAIVITPRTAGVAAPPVTRIGDEGRGEKWRIGPLVEPPGEDALYRVTVSYGRPGHSVDKTFDLTLRPPIRVTGGSYDVRPGTPLDLDVAGGTPPYTVTFDPALPGLAATQPAGKIRLLADAAPETVTDVRVIVTDSANPAARGLRHVSVKNMPPLLLPNNAADYFDYVRPATRGLAQPLINGRSSGGAGPDIDLTEPLDAMENAVKALGAGDSIYLSAWLFEPATGLTAGGLPGVTTWGQLFASKAQQGVKVRILINDFDPIVGRTRTNLLAFLNALDALIAALPAAKRDNLKYLVCLHPAHVGPLKAALAGQGFRNIYVASHHQKFMVVRSGVELTAFCGGLDIESRKTPARWSYAGLSGWHDVHVQLQGPITRDLEREFIARWNRDRNASTRPPVAGWAAMEELVATPLSPADDSAARKLHLMQMVRTVSDNAATGPYETKRDDIKQTYRRAIGGATRFLYLENQYFRSPELAQWIVAAGTAHPALVVIMVVVASAADDDGDNAVTRHGNHLQFETFDPIMRALGARLGIYTMAGGRAVHSKFMVVDDEWMTIGSANANVRSFELDSELNLQIADAPLTAAFRKRLWAHNLGVPEATVAGWVPADFLGQWNSVAAANRGRTLPEMAGEGIIPYDYRASRGEGHGSIPDAVVDLDIGVDSGLPEERVA